MTVGLNPFQFATVSFVPTTSGAHVLVIIALIDAVMVLYQVALTLRA
jgi:hypothetical protein